MRPAPGARILSPDATYYSSADGRHHDPDRYASRTTPRTHILGPGTRTLPKAPSRTPARCEGGYPPHLVCGHTPLQRPSGSLVSVPTPLSRPSPVRRRHIEFSGAGEEPFVGPHLMKPLWDIRRPRLNNPCPPPYLSAAYTRYSIMGSPKPALPGCCVPVISPFTGSSDYSILYLCLHSYTGSPQHSFTGKRSDTGIK